MAFTCKPCGLDKFSTLYGLEQHREAVHNIRIPIDCYACGKNFPKKSSMLQHIKKHSNVSLKCLSCEKECSNMSGLIKHAEDFHNTNSPITNAVCVVSNDDTVYNQDYVIHPKTGLLFAMPKNPQVIGYQDSKGEVHKGHITPEKLQLCNENGISVVNVTKQPTVYVSKAFLTIN